MNQADYRGGDDRRSSVGDLLLAALSLRGDAPLGIGELMVIANDQRMNMSTVLAWVARAEEGGIVEQLTHPDDGERALRLTAAGQQVASNNRRLMERRGRQD